MPALRRCSRTRCCSAPVLTADASSPAARSCLVPLLRCLPGPAPSLSCPPCLSHTPPFTLTLCPARRLPERSPLAPYASYESPCG
jgi:hypothetical protein